MGNCIIHESQEQWGGEDWGPAVASTCRNDEDKNDRVGFSGLDPKPIIRTEVKLKITKKQLHELIRKTDLQGMSVQEALKQLMKASAQYETNQKTSWRPRLQSIPEANSFRLPC